MSDISPLLLSTDTLSGYGLDMAFSYAKKTGFDGVDIAMRTIFDSRAVSYVKELSERYDIPVPIIQVPGTVNKRDMSVAIQLAEMLESSTIVFNPTKFFDVQSHSYVKSIIPKMKKKYPLIKFSIINGPKETHPIIPIPVYHYTSLKKIISDYEAMIGLDISHLDSFSLDQLLDILPTVIPYLEVVYLSDRISSRHDHATLGSGSLPLRLLLEKFAKNNYKKPFSLKLKLTKKQLARHDEVQLILQQNVAYYKQHFVEKLS